MKGKNPHICTSSAGHAICFGLRQAIRRQPVRASAIATIRQILGPEIRDILFSDNGTKTIQQK